MMISFVENKMLSSFMKVFKKCNIDPIEVCCNWLTCGLKLKKELGYDEFEKFM